MRTEIPPWLCHVANYVSLDHLELRSTSRSRQSWAAGLVRVSTSLTLKAAEENKSTVFFNPHMDEEKVRCVYETKAEPGRDVLEMSARSCTACKNVKQDKCSCSLYFLVYVDHRYDRT